MHAQSVGAIADDQADPTPDAEAVFTAGVSGFAELSARRRPS
jgi:hypothetical protein